MPTGLSAINTANAWLAVLRGNAAGVTFTAPAVQAVKLHVGDPGAAGTASPAVGDATRKAVGFGAPVAGSMSMSTTAPVWTNAGTDEQLSHITTWDSTTAGSFQYSAALTAAQNWSNGNTFTLTTLVVALTPLAA